MFKTFPLGKVFSGIASFTGNTGCIRGHFPEPAVYGTTSSMQRDRSDRRCCEKAASDPAGAIGLRLCIPMRKCVLLLHRFQLDTLEKIPHSSCVDVL